MDSTGAVGGSNSLALDGAGVPHIAYYDASVGSMKYASRTGGVWSSDYVLIGGERGINPSLVLDSEENPHISCHGGTDDDLWYAVRKNGLWLSQKLDSLNHKGFDSAIQMAANDNPVLCYYDFTAGDLLFAEGVHPIRVPEHFPTIQQALDAAWTGDSVNVASGTYTGSGNRNLSFGGKDLIVYSGDGQYAATVDCQGLASGFVFGSGETTASVVDGFRIQASNSAGVLCTNASSATIKNCEITGITAGRAVHLDGSSAIVEDCWIHDNTGSDNGIGMQVQLGAPTIRDCLFERNMDLGFSAEGGAMMLVSTAAVVESCTFAANISGQAGGAIYVSGDPSPTITGCIFEGNRARSGVDKEDGGAIYCLGATPSITGCLFRGNQAEDGGAIALVNFGAHTLEVTIEECIFGGNSADAAGGGLWIRGYLPTIRSSTLADNSAGTFGGGIHFTDDDTAMVEQTIVWNNCAVTGGDEIYFDENGGTSDVRVTFLCSDVDSTGFAGPGDWILLADNFALDPMFLDPGSCPGLIGSDYGVDCDSPCQPQNSPCGERVGAAAGACVVAVIDGHSQPLSLLSRAVPNPFAGSTHIHYVVPEPGQIDLSVYDSRGRLVRTLRSGRAGPGETLVIWDGLDGNGRWVAPGVYFVRLKMERQEVAVRAVLLRR